MNIKDISFEPTGDPFVDAGGIAMAFAAGKYAEELVLRLIERVATVYVEAWGGKINSLYLNSRITHMSRKGQEKVDATLELYQSMLTPPENTETGYCRICGSSEALFEAGREQFCLSGSAPFVNFHHGHEAGLTLCKSCSIKLFFLPLIVVQMGGNLALFHCRSNRVKDYWVKKTVAENFDKLARDTSEGILKSDLRNPRNALFHMAADIILETEDPDFSDFIQLFHFTNFGAGPDCEIYALPDPVFNFMSRVLRYNKVEWFRFVRRHYRIKQSHWDEAGSEWLKKSGGNVFDETEYRDNPNMVFERLLVGRSILPLLKSYYRDIYKNTDKEISIMIVYHYVKEVLHMKQETLDIIKRVANVIFDLSRQEDNFKKYLTMIEGAGRAHELRAVLLKVVKTHFRNGNVEPVLRLDDYVNYLFPDGQYWGEVRDLMLIYLYEKMHEARIDAEAIPEKEVVTAEEEINSL